MLLTAALARGKGAAALRIGRTSALANPELGAKQICPNCSAKFYDLGRRPALCPKCGETFDPEEAVRNRRVSEIIQMTLVESAVMFFEVIFLYRELIDAVTPWIAQQSAGEVRLGLVSTLLLAS